MQAGKLNSRVVIKYRGASVDSIGQPVETWTTLATVWADVRYLSGSESIKSNQDGSDVKASIRIRNRSDVTAGMRVVFGSVTFDIEAVLPDTQKKDRLDLVCKVL